MSENGEARLVNLLDLQRAHDYSDLANLFGVSAMTLKANLYGGRGYWAFDIPKKGGGFRHISAPMKIRKGLQKSLLPVLTDIYRPNPSVHGFVPHRNVRTNAKAHLGKCTVVNVDLLNFFPSISFQRVRGIFLAPPFRLSWATANMLAQVCCDQGALPAGGVTSPALSNIVCARMDKRLIALCQRFGGGYTRYADDMTMSFDRPLRQVSSIVVVDELGAVTPGGALEQIISEEGFAINPEKLRAATNKQRKIVTGLVINERINTRRSWYLALESLIYAVEKFGLANIALQEFPEEKNQDIAARRLLRRLHGKLAFYRMVRGRGDWLVAELANRFNRLHADSMLRVSDVEIISKRERLWRGALVVVGYNEPMAFFDDTMHQGTGFVTKSGLIVTAAHVLVDHQGDPLPHVYVMNERKLVLVKCEIVALDSAKDVAILRPYVADHDLIRSRFSIGEDLIRDTDVIAVGFPGYTFTDSAVTVEGRVTQLIRRGGKKIALFDAPIRAGTSGGPVVDDDYMVRGIVHRDDTGAGGIAEAVPISDVIAVAVAAGLRL